MRKQRTLATLTLAAALFLSLLAGCSGTGDPTPTVQPTSTPGQSQPPQTPEGSQPVPAPAETQPTQGEEGGKTLVVYYSATGSTKAVAETIADTLGADLFEIVPEEPYTSADLTWTDETSRVSREHEDPSLRSVPLTSATPESWDDYDTVFIGYPIWWGIAAWPVDGFIAANDFTGKTVIPFCTSTSSGLGESGQLLAQAAGNGDWLDGRRFSGGVSETEVTEWVSGLSLAP